MKQIGKKTTVYVTDLVLETTRRCNMSCAHCLRGEAECLDMPDKTILRLLESVDSISTVTFSGGEPSLNIHAIRYFLRTAEQLGKLPPAFYVVTNGKENQEELAMELLKWYPKMDDKDCCGVSISIDRYHEKGTVDTENSILQGLAFFRDDKTVDWEKSYLISEGRAKKLKGVRFKDWSEKPDLCADVYEYADENNISIETLYVAANGNVVGNCDMSYERIDKEAVCTIGTFDKWLKEHVEDQLTDQIAS